MEDMLLLFAVVLHRWFRLSQGLTLCIFFYRVAFIHIAFRSVCPSVCLSLGDTMVLYQNQ